MISRAAALVAASAAAVSMAVGPALASSSPSAPFWITRACPTEDSVNCYWDAAHRGDHRGHSYVVRRLAGGVECTFYIDRRYAARHDHCR